jgi:phosphoribosylformylglycinamidine (FGAM) synthase-like amidotransferase family enzyme
VTSKHSQKIIIITICNLNQILLKSNLITSAMNKSLKIKTKIKITKITKIKNISQITKAWF